MSTFWLVFHIVLAVAAVVYIARWAWGKIRSKFTPGL